MFLYNVGVNDRELFYVYKLNPRPLALYTKHAFTTMSYWITT